MRWLERTSLSAADWVSLSRVVLALSFLVLFQADPGALLVICIGIALAAQLSDHLDGYLARVGQCESTRGWVFDSVADRAFYVAALLAFDREYALGPLLLWLFVMREIALYASRVSLGDFEARRPGFRRLALTHALLVRTGIALGCFMPFASSTGVFENRTVILQVAFGVATAFGYSCLMLLARGSRRSQRTAGGRASLISAAPNL